MCVSARGCSRGVNKSIKSIAPAKIAFYSSTHTYGESAKQSSLSAQVSGEKLEIYLHRVSALPLTHTVESVAGAEARPNLSTAALIWEY